MKITQAVLFLVLVGAVNAHADLGPGVSNCSALVTDPAKKAEAQTQINYVYAANTSKPVTPPRPANDNGSSH